jgi:HD-GYP domain-containing protein (c-di-GMP phosphodiesterase class II)
MSMSTAALDLQTQLVAASRERVGSRLSLRERLTHGLSAVAVAVGAASLAVGAWSPGDEPWPLLLLFVGTIAVASRIELEVGSGFASPVELVVIPMLFAVPAAEVPAVVVIALVLGQLPSSFRESAPSRRILMAVSNAVYAFAPSLVVAVGYEPGADPTRLAALTAVAVGAQFAADALVSTLREHLAVGVHPRSLIRPLAWTFFVDACFAPVGFAAALAGSLWTPAYALPLPLLLLTKLFANERADRLSQTLELSAAYRGTAFLLGDVVEADDAYTGAHSRDVVELSVAVADQLGLDARTRHLAELTALLHDVGKIRIPNEIINKNGPLTPEERAIINTHTIEGEQLLAQVGGLLAEVGRVVRSCHERHDGGGYPDGLAGDDIPIVARIVCCCDAFNAMTTTRAYRKAMSIDEARAELVRHRGTQFDPDVVDAVLAISAADDARVGDA